MFLIPGAVFLAFIAMLIATPFTTVMYFVSPANKPGSPPWGLLTLIGIICWIPTGIFLIGLASLMNCHNCGN